VHNEQARADFHLRVYFQRRHGSAE
jgi:hypothetical protein